MAASGPGEPASGAWWVEWRNAGEPRRALLTCRLSVGRSQSVDLRIDDPYVSREHCILELEDGGVRVDASHSMNRVLVGGRDFECVLIKEAGSFLIGQTTIQLRPVSPTDDSTLHLSHMPPAHSLRRSTRELIAADGTVNAQLSASEGTALYEIAIRFPDAADHDTIGRAIWGGDAYDRYLIHRLVQRLRDRMGDSADLIENVRGSGYRLKAPLDMC